MTSFDDGMFYENQGTQNHTYNFVKIHIKKDLVSEK